MSKHSELIGIWRLLSFDVEYQASGLRKPYYGDQGNTLASGFMILTPEGRMMVLVAGGGREPGQTDEKQAALFRTMLSYTGIYKVEEDKFITAVDVSWNELWTGTEQVRYFVLEDDRLDIMTAWMPHPLHSESIVRGVLSWERTK